MPRREYFSFPEKTDQFDKALARLIQNLTREERTKVLPPENTMRYTHGINWVTLSSDSSDNEGEMKILSTKSMISMENIRKHNLEALPSFISDIVKQMHESMQKMMYQTVADACDKTGNTINANDYETTADAFLATLKKIEFGVDRKGSVSIPELHLGSQAFAAFKNDAEAKGKSFQKEVEKVIQEKSEAALEREKQRIARFKT